MDDDTIEVHCGRCGKSMMVRLADIGGKRLVDCVDCERRLQPRDWPRLVRDENPDPALNVYLKRPTGGVGGDLLCALACMAEAGAAERTLALRAFQGAAHRLHFSFDSVGQR
jgi:hypothetical protein